MLSFDSSIQKTADLKTQPSTELNEKRPFKLLKIRGGFIYLFRRKQNEPVLADYLKIGRMCTQCMLHSSFVLIFLLILSV